MVAFILYTCTFLLFFDGIIAFLHLEVRAGGLLEYWELLIEDLRLSCMLLSEVEIFDLLSGGFK